ncbi:hypothetical protein JQX13_14850 [Archangium violaceum]|uniref:hypothetical protein n=1 Tax=Archangium violaceum TaxID=83451 RepID=UPI00193B2127|nr:hypothetical protein [Archangium violaceum]QRK11234.1 hypothetical protein JQX13_14850 [Archangium violaceum]
MEDRRVRLLGLRQHEGTGAEVEAVGAEGFRQLLEWARLLPHPPSGLFYLGGGQRHVE